MGYYIFIIMYHYSALFLFVRPAANEKKPHPAGFVAFLRAELSNHICSGGYTRYGTHYHEYLGFSPHKQVTADYYRVPCKCFSIAARYSHTSFVNLSHDGASQWCLSGIHRRITKLQPDLSPKTRSKSLKHDPSLTHSIHY